MVKSIEISIFVKNKGATMFLSSDVEHKEECEQLGIHLSYGESILIDPKRVTFSYNEYYSSGITLSASDLLKILEHMDPVEEEPIQDPFLSGEIPIYVRKDVLDEIYSGWMDGTLTKDQYEKWNEKVVSQLTDRQKGLFLKLDDHSITEEENIELCESIWGEGCKILYKPWMEFKPAENPKHKLGQEIVKAALNAGKEFKE